MVTRKANFTKSGIQNLPNDKPVVYKIESEGGRNNYTGIASRGRVRERLSEHLAGAKDAIPGAKIKIQQVSTVAEARAKESRIIARSKPKYNKQGK